MDTGQLRLIPAPQPLVERLGDDFFQSIPRLPGVYRMYDGSGLLVYVGKAGDLRARLGSYRRVSGQSRKTVRLIHAVRRIEWDVCETETAARLAENDLIRRMRPRFNRAGTWPRSARYIRVEEREGGFRLSLAAEVGGECHGPFRGGPGWALAAMGRLLWLAWRVRADVAALPRRWVVCETVRVLELEHSEAPGWLPDVRQFLKGDNDGLMARLVASMPPPTERFDQAYLAQQFETVEAFYRHGPLRNRRLRERFGWAGEVLTPERLDDWAIEAGPMPPAPAFRPEDNLAT